MATLRMKRGSYFLDYRVNGRRIRKDVGTSKTLAQLALKDTEVKLARKELGFEEKDSTFTKLMMEYKDYCKTNNSPNTQKRYQAILDNFMRYLKEKHPYITKLSQFSAKIFDDYKTFRKGEKAKPRTINMELAVVRTIFKFAIQWGYSKANPTDGVDMLKEVKKNAPRFLTEDECDKLLTATDEWFRRILTAFLNSGMRKSELEYLEWNDIEWNRRRIKILVKTDWQPKTDELEIPINDKLLAVLLKQKDDAKSSKYVFPDENGNLIDHNLLRRRLMSLTKKVDLKDVTKIHTLRHTFASHLVMKGVDLTTVGKLLGHANIQTTMIYAHLTQKHVELAVDKLNF